MARKEPCPVFQGRIVLRIIDRDWRGPQPDKFPLLFGQAIISDQEGRYHDADDAHRSRWRETTGRMTALLTEIQMPDGHKEQVCGVLMNDPMVPSQDDIAHLGIPILAPKYYGKPASPFWRGRVYFFWPGKRPIELPLND